MANDEKKTPESADEELLREIRDNYAYGTEMWREAREQRKIDLRYLLGDPWEPEDRRAREEAGRPCISHDELNQYVNQCVNSARENKRGVKIEPAGNGATDKTAEYRQNHVRAIEYKSKAPAIYLSAFQSEVEGGYGFCRISRRYLPGTFDQEIVVGPIPNSDSVIYDPDCKEPDWRDAGWCFVLQPIPRREFPKRWRKAKIQNFTHEDMLAAPDWIREKDVLTAEYWRIEKSERTLYQLADGSVVEDLAEGQNAVRTRKEEVKKLVQYWTNGVEILERSEQPGDEIPIPAFIGMERWVDEGSGAKRKISSLVRLGRDPQMSLAYLASQEAEEAGLTPKSPYVGYVGQFETDGEAWDTCTKVPHARLQADPIVDGSNGQVLPLPRREQFTPNFGAYEVAKESARRAIQAAMGISPLPTAAQRQNEKSGIALQRIQTAQAVGSYHFVDGFDRAVERAGRIIDSWLAVTYDTERDLALRKRDDTQQVVRANTPQPYVDPRTQEQHHYVVDQGDHDVTISTGPSDASQREAASDFLDTLIANLKALPVAPPQAAKLLALAIQMKQLGPKGDEMAEIISPDTNGQLPPQAMQAMQQSQQQQKQLMAYIQELQGQLQQLQQEKQAKVVDNEYRLQIEKLKIDAQLAMAEVNTKAQQLGERIKFVEDVWQQLHSQAHDAAMQAADQAHDAAMAAAQPQPAQAPPEQPEQPEPQISQQ